MSMYSPYEVFGYNSRAEYEYYNPPYDYKAECEEREKEEAIAEEKEIIIDDMTEIAEKIYKSKKWETEQEFFDEIACYDLSEYYGNYDEHTDWEVDDIFTGCAEKIWENNA